jgi:hypothetical protein
MLEAYADEHFTFVRLGSAKLILFQRRNTPAYFQIDDEKKVYNINTYCFSRVINDKLYCFSR